MSQEHQQKNPTEEMSDQLSQTAKNGGKKVGRAVAKKGKEMLKKAGKKLLKQAGKVAVKLLAKAVTVLLPYLLPVLGVIALAFIAYYVVFEIRGSEQIYVYEESAENETHIDKETNERRTDSSSLSSQTQQIKTYYKYMSQHSYWQILGDDNEKLEQTEDIRDYYKREDEYLLNSNIIFSLDQTMHKNNFIYPEQFIKPLYYDPEKLELKSLINEKGEIIVESEEYDKDGDLTGKKVTSIADYGLGSIFKYKKDERTLTVEGTMYKKDVWDESCNCKKTVDTNEPFSYTMEGFPEEIYLMEKAVTFVGEFSFTYKEQKKKQSDLQDNATAGGTNQPVSKVEVGQGKQMKTEYYSETETYTVTEKDADGNDKQVVKTREVQKSRQVFDKWVPLYGYRKGGIYETVPVLEKTTPNDKGEEYLRAYLYHYKTYIPQSVLGEFDLTGRGVDANGIYLANLQGGTGLESGQYQKALQYYPIIKKYAEMYGVDPYLVIAKIAQESAGNADIEDGLMQITGNGERKVTAYNVLSNQNESYSVYSEADRRNPEKAIRWGIMYFANLIKKMDGDPFKALQSYNFGEGGVTWIKKNYPESWNSDAWMAYREDSRLHYGGSNSRSASYDCIPNRAKTSGSVYGDSCYVEHVLRYYGGAGVQMVDTTDAEKADDNWAEKLGDSIATVFKNIGEVFSEFVVDYSEETKFYPYERFVNNKDVDWALRLATAMEGYQLFSRTGVGDEAFDGLDFWEGGYSETLNTANLENFVATEDVEGFQIPYNLPGAPITSYPGNRVDPIYGDTRYHAGTDIAIPKNTPLYASADGEVTETHTGETYNNGAGYGNYIKIKHANNITTLYAHMTSLVVKNGQQVKKGELIGYSGSTGKSTGYHLHFEVRQDGIVMDSSLIISGSSGKLVPAP